MKKKFHLKRLYSFILQTFLPLFSMTFVICLFLVLMQFLWKYIEDMVGKGLELKVLGEMFLYASLNLIPLALPLSILLASIMVFGNLGERLELLAIKSAGVPLLKTMKPLIILIIFISIGAFFFQNYAMPKIQVKFYSLLISIRQKSPELDIPEGVFYKDIDNYNIFVEKKNRKTGMLYDVMIYDVSKGFNNMAVIVCDSASMRLSEDKLSLIFTMHHGQQFQNFQSDNLGSTKKSEDFVPYSREDFKTKQMLVPFDANFNRMDDSVLEENVGSNWVSKNSAELKFSIDSMNLKMDSMNLVDRKQMKSYSYLSFRNSYDSKKDSIERLVPNLEVAPMDTILNNKSLEIRTSILRNAVTKADNNTNEFLFRSMSKVGTQKAINRHWVEWHRKFTLSFACFIFFFIGAPLGSIIRKGGLGMPIVVSVFLFIIYYILDNVGYKMTRDGVWIHWVGMWFSSFILFPLGIFLTYKAMNDSVILNADSYLSFVKKMFFIREQRHFTIKEVIISPPVYKEISNNLSELNNKIDFYLDNYRNMSYKTYWFDSGYDNEFTNIKNELESMLNSLANSAEIQVLKKAEEYPVLISNQRPLEPQSTGAKIAAYFIPVGLIMRLISRLFEKRLNKDLVKVKKLNNELQLIIERL
ncbi:MAG: LptF/LptG family permease [Dysgonamonadaceae bacterium]|nr:LptF/LptG family permease [Dysgonamonadaceae bacterium]MDD3355702.1 LptF/LptG family permease [Dysgonamonadaceae bacterium]MDD4246148.1 LptF/LptG family permease [Dysgonamonadaceae bacterium]